MKNRVAVYYETKNINANIYSYKHCCNHEFALEKTYHIDPAMVMLPFQAHYTSIYNCYLLLLWSASYLSVSHCDSQISSIDSVWHDEQDDLHLRVNLCLVEIRFVSAKWLQLVIGFIDCRTNFTQVADSIKASGLNGPLARFSACPTGWGYVGYIEIRNKSRKCWPLGSRIAKAGSQSVYRDQH